MFTASPTSSHHTDREESPGFSAELDFDPAYPQVFLLMVKWYWEPDRLSQQLLEFYRASLQVAQAEEGSSVAAATQQRKWAIARAFRYWREHFPEDFRSHSPLVERVMELQETMRRAGDSAMAEYISLDAMPEDTWLHHSVYVPRREYRRPSLGFDATSARDLAEILCALDYKLVRRIPFREFCIYAHLAKPTEDTPRIDECIQLFNGITIWVVCNILREFTMFKRADIIEKFIETTRYLYELHSYNTMLAVVGGLNHFAIRRLSQTWSKIDKAKKEELNKWTNFFSSQMNYGSYRQTVAQLDGAFHIPVLGIMLKDLVAIDAQAKDIMNPVHETLNMAKYRKLWGVLSNIRASQLKPPDTVPDLDKMRVLRAAINQSHMEDDALDELSESREPRQRDSASLTSEADLPSFSSWAAGQNPHVDTDTLTKNVKQMVDAVFRVYDKDHSGNISMEEFEIISSNFPFIENFSVLDQDNDGTISYDELLQYFLSANSLLRERFTHNFVEHTFISAPVCQHCKGMMKGIVRQGMRCKDCGISCHKHCKDHLVVDCSKRKERKGKKPRVSQANQPHTGELYCDDDISLKERLQRAEEARDALSAENAELHAKLAEANAKIQQLQAHISQIRQHTIGFILEQMNTLNPQHSSTEV